MGVMQQTQKSERTRLTVGDWEQGALDMIAEQGVGALAVEALARRLGVTKGSFYWHFRNRESLLKSALESWEQNEEAEVLAGIESIDEPRARLREVFHRVAHEMKSHRIYAALLKVLDHPVVLPLMGRVTQRRMQFLTEAYLQIGMPPRTAAHRARLAYAAFIGFLQLNLTLGMPRLSHEEFDAYVEHVATTLIP